MIYINPMTTIHKSEGLLEVINIIELVYCEMKYIVSN